ncbi:MAG TPA: protein-L-isoaspartate(D-aspartate) O-methyltransferase [Gammaproteobacteria bacterium]|nr:protein-L-isoaspartate(D-aspartate) O-methyltransferase [Gammaproteobacteria bacterium]
MLDELMNELRQQGIHNEAVLKAMVSVRRDLFVDQLDQSKAHCNQALSIGYSQTISQPYVVARMTELLLEKKQPNSVLEIGTGSGYQTAILAECIPHVYSLERIKPLYQLAKSRLQQYYPQVELGYADGYRGWEKKAPFDAIMITAASEIIPEKLLQQLAVGGYMVLPLGESGVGQQLCRVHKTTKGMTQEYFEEVVFVPMLPGKKEQ